MPHSLGDGIAPHNIRILVAGSGEPQGVPEDVCLASAALGRAIARSGCGLVTGGWHGVDYMTAEAFIRTAEEDGTWRKDRLVQVTREDSPLLLNRGLWDQTKVGPGEWSEPEKYANAVVLLGGL